MDTGPFVASPGKRVFNDTRAQAEKRAANATRIAYMCGAVAILSGLYANGASRSVRPVPHVVLVNPDGRSVTVEPISQDRVLRDVVTAKQLKNFVHSFFKRTGSYAGDKYDLATDVVPLVLPNDPSYTTINARLGDPALNLKTSQTLATVDIEVPQKRSDDSWYIKWMVTTMKPTGERISAQAYDVTSVIRYRNLGTEADQTANPTGLEIVTFPFQPFGIGGS